MLRELFVEALKLKDVIDDYREEHRLRNQLGHRLDILLDHEIERQSPKFQPFHKRLRKNRDYLFPFLYHEMVPPDNNA